MRTSILALLACAVFSAQVSSQELWVDAKNGNDRDPGTAALPLQTITHALSLAATGTTVFIRSGVYSTTSGEVFPLAFGTTNVHDGVTLYGLPGAVIDLQNSASVSTAIQIGTGSTNGRITGLVIQNMARTGNEWWHKAIEAGSYNGSGAGVNFEIDRCHFKDVNRGIVIWVNSPSVSTWKIHNNLFTGLGNDGINEFDQNSDNTIFNNSFVGSAHIAIMSDAAKTAIKNNIYEGCRVGMASGNAGQTVARIAANCFHGNTVDVEGAGFPGGAVPAGNFPGVDPLFVNAGAGDYHLKTTSPLVDMGESAVPSRADLDMVSGAVDYKLAGGAPRPDVGAYELTPIDFTADYQNGVLSFSLQTTNPSISIGFVAISFDDGLIKIPGWTPLLVDPATLMQPLFVGGFPLAVAGPASMPPVGARLIFYGAGVDTAKNVIVGGRQVRLQF